jgi:hypothetical protein
LTVRRLRFQEDVGADYAVVRERFRQRIAMHADGRADGTVDLLALSGGGAMAAFGAGFLQGWKDRPDEFDVVTGVSSGSLVAPYAFVNTDAALGEIVTLFRNPGPDWVNLRLFGAMFGRRSLLDSSGLNEEMDRQMSDEFLAQIGAGVDDHRSLLIATTDLDLGWMRIWDATRIAREKKTERFKKVLLASAALPGIFAPIEIDGQLHADGGTSAQYIGGVDLVWIQEALERLKDNPDSKLRELRLWVIVNNKVESPAQAVPLSWSKVLERGVTVIMRQTTVTELRMSILAAEALQHRYGVKCSVRYVAIPRDTAEVPLGADVFDAAAQQILVDVGRRMGADPSSWRTTIENPQWPVNAD